MIRRFVARVRNRALRLACPRNWLLRLSVWLLLAIASFAGPAARGAAEATNPAGVSLGGALWAEIGGSDCSVVGDPTSCTTGQNPVFYGGLVAFDLDLLHWLRIGLVGGLGYAGGEETLSFDGVEHKRARHWFFPLTVHMYWRVELGKRITLWGGPEVGLGLYVIDRTASTRLSHESGLYPRAAFVAGVAIGLDVRLVGAFRIGVELGEAVLVKQARENADLDIRATTRFALVFRYL
jgi:hypothetical protein